MDNITSTDLWYNLSAFVIAIMRDDVETSEQAFAIIDKKDKKETKKVKFTTNIDEEILREVKNKAKEEGKKVNEIIEKLLREYLKR